MRLKKLCCLLAFALMPSLASAAGPDIGQPAPAISGKTAEGKTVHLSDYKGKIVVLEWSQPECPFVKKFYDSGTMQRLQMDATNKGIVWLTVNSSAKSKQGYVSPRQAKDFIAVKQASPTAYILDSDGVIGKAYDAKNTPHMFVIDQNGNLAYAGAIDDKPGIDALELAGARNYVAEAIDALLAGHQPAVSTTQPYGCNVKYKS